VRLRIHIERSIRTGLRTSFTTDTAALIKVYNTIIASVQCLDRTDIDTGRLCAMVAPKNGKISSAVGKCPLFYVFDPGTIHSERHLVFGFACHCTCVTPDTLSGINNKAVIHGVICSK
jgi:hypothetical protein